MSLLLLRSLRGVGRPAGRVQVSGVIQRGDGMAGEWVEVQCAKSRQVQAFVLGDMVADAEGRHTHTIIAHATPGVLHTTIFSMAARKVCCLATACTLQQTSCGGWPSWHTDEVPV